jgi:hypothetical protein
MSFEDAKRHYDKLKLAVTQDRYSLIDGEIDHGA